jgi:hypothetical protein
MAKPRPADDSAGIRNTPSVAIESAESFVPMALPSKPAENLIRIEVRRR